jgi:hypothetical protein
MIHMKWLFSLFLMATLALSPPACALVYMGGDLVSIDSPVEDDLFAGGDIVYVNAPVDSAIIAGGTVSIDAPIKEDLIVFGGNVVINSDVGGKIVAAGGTIDLRGDVERNVVMAGGTVRILSSSDIGRDAAISGGRVYNGGNVTGTLWVNAGNFENAGTAGDVKYTMREEEEAEEKSEAFISTFSILMILGFLIVGILILKLFPRGVFAVDQDMNRSPAVKALLGFGLIVASMVLIVISMISVVGIPLGILLLAFVVAALLLANLFVSFSLGRWIATSLNRSLGAVPAFVLGYLVLSVLFHVPYAGPVIELISVSLGFGAMISSLNETRKEVGGETSEE